MKTLGICFGATTIQAVKLHFDPQFKSVEWTKRIAHEGNPRSVFTKLLGDIEAFDIDAIAITGRNFRSNVKLTGIAEPLAVECALREEYRGRPMPELIISAGGETQLVYKIGPHGGIVSVMSGNKCASGTGEFFLQQVRRMGLSLDDAVQLALRGKPHKIAGRCSVFCKSDCTHALNKGEPRENIVAGLCVMMADKLCEIIKDVRSEHVGIIGGGSLNRAMIDILAARFKLFDVPELAPVFEAFGAAIWAGENPCLAPPAAFDDLFTSNNRVFDVHPSLQSSISMVDFKEQPHGQLSSGEECVLGLDVGSTTTKAVVVRKSDRMIVASVYLRTSGRPVEAARQCYRALREAVGNLQPAITGLGVTGSGRQIAALHGLTDNVINEIIAHGAAAAHFDKDVDTIFEIGGQDAKYTFLSAGIPSDYAMNEACSAGTGSFLEESAFESLGVKTEDIGEMAMQALAPPNFTDQCSAFISSDIKQATQQGIGKNDILAGLVYSVCMNYINRVKGLRPVGKKIFMQGGVCYNRAVPLAMASLMKTRIIVPPHPGLMGAYGVALEVINRFALGISKPAHFNLDAMIERDALRVGNLLCSGGAEKCDRKCDINKFKIDGKTYLFGGACNKYYNTRFKQDVDVGAYDLVDVRQKLLFDTFGTIDSIPDTGEDTPQKTVGILRSFLTHSLFPLYSRFFHKLDFKVILSDGIDAEGISRAEAAFCLPAEISHGSFFNLLKKKLDYIFLPHVMQLPVPHVPTYSRTCVFVQGEPYYLPVTFRGEIELGATRILSPVLVMDKGYEFAEGAFIEMGTALGVAAPKAKRAFMYACEKQKAFERELREEGRKFFRYLDAHPEKFGIVLFGRPYNAFAQEANMTVAHKVASRGHLIVPYDMLSADDYDVNEKMFWAMGQKIMKAAQLVKKRANVFGFYITNFSCGPDAFLLDYFRDVMKSKPSLTLELDQHTADAGLDTRIEAALDIMAGYGLRKAAFALPARAWSAARVEYGPAPVVTASDGSRHSLFSPQVELVLPSMGRHSTEAMAAIMRGLGIRATALHIADKNVLLEGKKNASCKECLPYLVTTGSFLTYLHHRRDPKRVTLLFMPTGGGPCRLGQYCVALDQLIKERRIDNAAVFTLTDENGYAGMGSKALLKAWQSIVIADVFGDIKSLLCVAAHNRGQALLELESAWKELLAYFEGRVSTRLTTVLSIIAKRLSHLKLKFPAASIPVVSLVGEIFVRRDEFSRKNILDYLESHGFAVRVAPVAEYICYGNYVINSGLGEREFTRAQHFKMLITARVQRWWERRIKTLLARSGLYRFEMIDVDSTIDGVKHLINVNFRGEAILTVGLAMREMLGDSCGVISIGPFGCMPSRVSEAILKKEMNGFGKARMFHNAFDERFVDNGGEPFPFLAIETDGAPFPLLTEANLEAFIVQARRLHELRQKMHSSSISLKISRKAINPLEGNK